MGFHGGLLEAALLLVLVVATCWGMIIYLVWPEGCKPGHAQKEIRGIRELKKEDLDPDDQRLLESCLASPGPKEKYPALYIMLLYSHSASGGRANSAERATRMVFGFAIAVIVVSLFRDANRDLAIFASAELVLLGGITLSRFFWSDAIVDWIRGKRNH